MAICMDEIIFYYKEGQYFPEINAIIMENYSQLLREWMSHIGARATVTMGQDVTYFIQLHKLRFFYSFECIENNLLLILNL